MENKETYLSKNNVHEILASSYSVYFVFLIIGVYFNLYFNFKIFDSRFVVPLGVFFLVFSSFLIIWAQHTSRNLNTENITKESFCRGPYCYTRAPTHIGLFLLILGFGMIINSFFVILFTLIAFVIAKLVFLKKEEKILSLKYGAPYLEYKKIVKF